MLSYQSGDVILEKYRVESLIGKGAFADVYHVIHLSLNAPRAIKILHKAAPGLGSTEYGEFQNRFNLEAQLGAKLNHANLIQVYDFERDGENLLLIMEYAERGSLASLLENIRQQGKVMPVNAALNFAAQITDGLAALHDIEIVHRDLKPNNILFDQDWRIKVADLGLAQIPNSPSIARSKLSIPTPHPGTVAYMSPEQTQITTHLTSASDIFALGLILFEMLTGKMYRSQKPGTQASDFRSDIPAWVDDLIKRMLADVPENRPWNGKEAANLLRAGMQGKSVAPQPEPARQMSETSRPQLAAGEKGKQSVRQENKTRKKQNNWQLVLIGFLAVCIISSVLGIGLAMNIPSIWSQAARKQASPTTPNTAQTVASTEILIPTISPTEPPVATFVSPPDLRLFWDDFETGLRPEWGFRDNNNSITNGQLAVESGHIQSAIIGDANWKNYRVRFLGFKSNYMELRIRVQDADNYMVLNCAPEPFVITRTCKWSRVVTGNWEMIPGSVTRHEFKDHGDIAIPLDIEVEVQGDVYRFYLNGSEQVHFVDTTYLSGGFVFYADGLIRVESVEILAIP